MPLKLMSGNNIGIPMVLGLAPGGWDRWAGEGDVGRWRSSCMARWWTKSAAGEVGVAAIGDVA